jgi:hypothetical protein
MGNVRTVMTRTLVSSALVGILAFASTAVAQTCPAACGQQKVACLQAARTVKLACKLDCRTNTPTPRTALGECMRGCMVTFRAAKDVCRTNHKACIAACFAGSPSGAFL